MFCVRNSPTLTPSHSWKQLWTKKSSTTKRWNLNMLKKQPENAWKRKLIQNADSMLVFKWKTTNVQNHKLTIDWNRFRTIYTRVAFISFQLYGPYGCFWNVEQGFGGYVLQLVRVNLCPTASVTIGTGSQQSIAIGYSLSRRLSIAIRRCNGHKILFCHLQMPLEYNIYTVYTLKYITIHKIYYTYLFGYDQPLSSPRKTVISSSLTYSSPVLSFGDDGAEVPIFQLIQSAHLGGCRIVLVGSRMGSLNRFHLIAFYRKMNIKYIAQSLSNVWERLKNV